MYLLAALGADLDCTGTGGGTTETGGGTTVISGGAKIWLAFGLTVFMEVITVSSSIATSRFFSGLATTIAASLTTTGCSRSTVGGATLP